MKYLFLITIILTVTWNTNAQLHATLWSGYDENYKEQEIRYKRFNHEQLVDILGLYTQNPDFDVSQLGTSIERRDIFKITLGKGDTKVLLWSQMHGNEPTATMAILDIFKFFTQDDDLNPVRKQILDACTLVFVPMLNPDGADKFVRRNAIDIDLNRDAVRLTSPESRALMDLRNTFNPEFGFNLHDQSRSNAAGRTQNPASISFLAPAYNYAKDINAGRENAMQLIAYLNAVLQEYIPENVGKYSDEFEPRAFGDNFQKLGTNTILIETGWRQGDDEKQFLRKVNFITLLSAFHAISNKTYESHTIEDYNAIPDNTRLMHDVILRGLKYPSQGSEFTIDIGFGREELGNKDLQSYYERTISDIGDLSVYHGYTDMPLEGFFIEMPKEKQEHFPDFNTLLAANPEEMLRNGYAIFQVESIPDPEIQLQLPFRMTNAKRQHENAIKIGANPVFYLKKNEKLRFLVSNGLIFDLQESFHFDRFRN